MSHPHIAVIGMACRFPGAKDTEAFWQNLRNGVESITFFSDQELIDAGVDPSELRLPNYVKAGTVLEDAELFDAAFFGYHGREAEALDPQQRVFLECAWHALEHAGCDAQRYPGSIGVFAGAGLNTYLLNNLLPERSVLESRGGFAAMLGNEKDYVSSRVAYKLNLTGPALTIQTACSTSLVAIHVGCRHLMGHQCDIALAGGVAVHTPQKTGYLHQDGMILSPDGHCRSFDAAAGGTIGGTGVGIVVLKRLEDALADGDTIYAVVRGSAINNDGSDKVGFTAPSVHGQAEVIALAHAVAEVSADTIEFVEGHGTATALGDPIEVAALTQAFRRSTQRSGFCALGSVKSNIGHADAAAGVAGFLKAVLALWHREIPPSLHFGAPNPEIDFSTSPFYVNTRLLDWPRGATPRRAGVSSFGIGGTNAHVVLEEAPAVEPRSADRPNEVLVISAKSASALEAATDNLARHLVERPDASMADVAHTLQLGRRAFSHRRAVVSGSPKEVVALLTARDGREFFTASVEADDRPVVFMFPGGGTQFPGMGRSLYVGDPLFQREVDTALSDLEPKFATRLRSLLLDEGRSAEAAADLERPALGLPLLFIIEYALARRLMAWGIHPTAMIGHSLGEYTAACLSGVLPLTDAVGLVSLRGRLFEQLPPGEMLNVPMTAEAIAPSLETALSVSAVNAPGQVVIGGPVPILRAFDKRLRARGIESVRLRIRVAAHSSMVEPILREFEGFVRSCSLQAPRIPYVSNLTGSWITAAEAVDPTYWSAHLRRTVRFADGLGLLLEKPRQVLLEVGPGRTLTNFARQHRLARSTHLFLPAMRHPNDVDGDDKALAVALAKLWVNGCNVDWEGGRDDERRQRVPLPGYPFERERYWVDSPSTARVLPPQATNQHSGSFEPGERGDVTRETEHHVGDVRRDAVLRRLQGIVHESTGIALADLDPRSTFLELGFDSLFLTQLTQAFSRAFGVPVRFRQLLEELTTLDRLASYLAPHVQMDAVRADPSTAASPVGAPPVLGAKPHVELRTAQRTLAPQGTARPSGQGLSAVEDIINQQLELMRQQLAVLGAASGQDTKPVPPEQASRAEMTEKRQQQRYTPFEPLKSEHPALNEHQRARLAEFVRRYAERAPTSKQKTDAVRALLADPRTVAGFRSIWKEMVFPTVSAGSSGSRFRDVDGNDYVDVTMGYGVNLFGHSPEFVTRAVREQLERGFELGPQKQEAGEVAGLLCELTGCERMTFCNTGSEAVLAALRVARTVTGRPKVAMFSGAYHGNFDEVLSRSQIVGGHRRSVPGAPGILPQMAQDVLVLEYGDEESLAILDRHRHELAAILVEPVQSRRPDFQPAAFIRQLRAFATDADIALVFDEMITGFRIHQGGAQSWFGVQADLATYGKVLGGGLPIGVLAGKGRFMDALDGGVWRYGDRSAPEAAITYFAGTFVRHPLSLAASRAVLLHLKQSGPGLQEELNQRTERLVGQLNTVLSASEAPIRAVHFGSLFRFAFLEEREHDPLFFFLMRYHGVDVWDRFNCFLSTAHGDQDLERVIQAAASTVAEMQDAGFLEGSGGGKASQPKPVNPGSAAAESGTSTGGVNGASAHTFPLTPSQAEIWLATRMSTDASRAYHEAAVLRLRGRLASDALARSAQELVNRHESLRLTFGGPAETQTVSAACPVPLEAVDFSHVPSADREAAARQWLTREAAREFDLPNGPIIRFHLLTLDADHHLFSLTVHHLVCDGWSIGRLLAELASLYAAFSGGGSQTLPPAPSFRQFALSTAGQDAEEVHRADQAYWEAALSGDLPILELPLDKTRPANRTYRAAQERRVLSPELVSALKRLGAERGCTLVSTLLAAFQILLHKLSGQTDLIVGLPAAVHASSGLEVVGHRTNLLPIRSRPIPEQPFSNFLQAVRTSVLDAYDHRHCSFGELVSRLRLARSSNRVPLVQVVFNLDKVAALDFPGLEVTSLETDRSYYNFELGFNCVEQAGALTVQCNYQTELFESSTIARWLDHFDTLLKNIVEHPTTPVSALSVMGDRAQQQLALRGADCPLDQSEPWSVHGLIEFQAARNPNRIAVKAGSGSLTYLQLNERANQLGRRLQRSGVGKGSLVAVCLDRSIDLAMSILAVLKAGAAYLPLDPTHPERRLRRILDEANADLLLFNETRQETFAAMTIERRALESLNLQLASEDATNLDVPVEPESLAYVIFTSGSTGTPKGVEITHGSLANLLGAFGACPGIGDQDVVLAMATVTFDMAVGEFFPTLAAGARLVIVPRDVAADGRRLIETMRAESPTLMHATPATWRLLLEAGWEGSRQLKVICGGESFDHHLADALLDRAASVWNGYGPTETTVYASLTEIGRGRPLSIGAAIANTTLHVLDSKRQPVPIGVVGELYIEGPGLARGYRNRPDLTRERFFELRLNRQPVRLYRTGDLVRRLGDGTLLFVGRNDDQVKVRGFRIECGDVEHALLEHEQIAEAVVCVQGAEGDKQLAAFLVPRGGQGISEPGLRDWLKGRLPHYMVPTSLVTLRGLPQTASGKIDRAALAALRRPDVHTEDRSALTATEQALTEIWTDILRAPSVPMRADFFDLGGHSLLAVRLLDRIERQFGRRLPFSTLYRHGTIESLARLIEPIDPAGPVTCVVPLHPDPERPLLFLAGGVGGEVLSYRALARRLGHTYAVYGLEPHPSQVSENVTVEELAARYVEDLRSVQPVGPYYLGGFCAGAALAFEVAQQLQSIGEEVGLLTIVDHDLVDTQARPASISEYLSCLLRNLPLWIREDAIPSGSMELLRRLLSRGRLAIYSALHRFFPRFSPLPDVRDSLGMWRFPDSSVPQIQRLFSAVQSYRPRSYRGRLLLLRPRTQPCLRPIPPGAEGWSGIATGEFSVEIVAGSHSTMLQEPFVGRTATTLLQHLNAAAGGARTATACYQAPLVAATAPAK